MTKGVPWRELCVIALIISALLATATWAMFNKMVQSHRRERVLEATADTLARVFPRSALSRNEMVVALTTPGGVPDVVDCVVRYGTLVFVFARSNEIVGIFPEGATDPFVTNSELASIFSCDDALLEAQVQRQRNGKEEWDRRRINALTKVERLLAAESPSWRKDAEPSQ